MPTIEWVCGGLGASAAILMLGYLLVEAATRSQAPAEIAVEVVGQRPSKGGIAVDIRVFNSGGTTAADVIVRSSEDDENFGEAVIDFVPPMSERRAVIMLTPGTVSRQFAVQVRGYRDP